MSRIAAGSGSSAFPFKIYNKSTGGSAEITVNCGDGFAGAVNGVIATLNGTPISYSGQNAPTLPVSDGNVVYVQADLDDNGNVLTVEILVASSLPPPDTNTPPKEAYLTIGTVSVVVNNGKATVTPTNIYNQSLFLVLCGQNLQWNT